MICSMTAFARQENSLEKTQLVCEIRSVNHRYLEVSVHLPDALRVLEMALRDNIRKHIKRGKVDCYIRLAATIGETEVTFSVNKQMLRALQNAHDAIASFIPSLSSMNPIEVMRFPGVMESSMLGEKEIGAEILAVSDLTLQQLVKNRLKEGKALLLFMREKLNQIEDILKKTRLDMPLILKAAREKLLNRFAEASVELNRERLEQEMVLFVQKIDVQEEIERAETHVQTIAQLLNDGGVVGRQLDFLLQELNREANTLGSKSVHAATSSAAVQLKVLIEQVREQAQNIE